MGPVDIRRIKSLPGSENIGKQKFPLVRNGKHPPIFPLYAVRYFKCGGNINTTLAETTPWSICGCITRIDATIQWIALWCKWDIGVSTRRQPRAATTGDHTGKEKSGCWNGKTWLSIGVGPSNHTELDILICRISKWSVGTHQ